MALKLFHHWRRKRRVAICRLLLQNPDILLLDEPTNHLDAQSVAADTLKGLRELLIVITHDRYFLSNVTEWILELDLGRAQPFKGNYESWLEQKLQHLSEKIKDKLTTKTFKTRIKNG